MDEDNVNADTSLADLDISRLSNIETGVNTARIETSEEISIFPANNLYKKMANNLAKHEAMVDDEVLRTEKTEELERREREDSE